jgi:hypothetical protein
LKYSIQSLLVCLLVHFVIMICVYISQEGVSFISNEVNSSKKDDKTFMQKYYLNFENNRFFIKFTIFYAIIFLIIRCLNEKRKCKAVEKINDEKKNK